MKSVIKALVISVALVAPVASFAQTSGQRAVEDKPAQSSGMESAEQGGQAAPKSDAGAIGRTDASDDTTVSSYSPPIHKVR